MLLTHGYESTGDGRLVGDVSQIVDQTGVRSLHQVAISLEGLWRLADLDQSPEDDAGRRIVRLYDTSGPAPRLLAMGAVPVHSLDHVDEDVVWARDNGNPRNVRLERSRTRP